MEESSFGNPGKSLSLCSIHQRPTVHPRETPAGLSQALLLDYSSTVGNATAPP